MFSSLGQAVGLNAAQGLANSIHNSPMASIAAMPYHMPDPASYTSNTTNVQITHAENGFVLTINRKVIVCTDLNDMAQQLVAAMIAERMEKK